MQYNPRMYLTNYTRPFSQYNSSSYGDLFFDLVEAVNYSSNQRFFNIQETDSGYSLELELAGFKKNEVKVELSGNILSIEAKSAKKNISKSFNIGRDIDSEKINALMEDGVLKISIGVKEENKPRVININ